MRSVYFEYAGVLSLLFIAIFLLAFIFPRVNDWSEDWRSYAHTSEYAGACSAPSPPPQCDEGSAFRGLDDRPLAAGCRQHAVPAGRHLAHVQGVEEMKTRSLTRTEVYLGGMTLFACLTAFVLMLLGWALIGIIFGNGVVMKLIGMPFDLWNVGTYAVSAVLTACCCGLFWRRFRQATESELGG